MAENAEIITEVAYISLTKGKCALIDLIDLEFINKYKWFCCGNGGYDYAHSHCAGEGRKRNSAHIKMHRLIMRCPKDLYVDHINGNGLDNRRCNLRICTHANNIRNSKSVKGKSRYKGVYMDSRRIKKYVARIKFNYKTIFLGGFENEDAAALAYNEAAIKYFGEFANLNPVKKYQDQFIL